MTINVVTKIMNNVINRAFNQSNLQIIGDETVRQLKGRVRKGNGVVRHDSEETRFAPLAKSTIKYKLKNLSELGEFARPKRSNLNHTGLMVDSISAQTNKMGFTINVGPERADIARYHHKGSKHLPKRPFLYLSRKEIKRLRTNLQDVLNNAINRLL